MNNTDTLVIIENNHPYFDIISSHYATRTPKDALASFDTYELIIDLTDFKTRTKIPFLKELARTTKAEIISDLTLCWGEMVLKENPKVTGALSLLFFSPTNAIEYYASTPKVKTQIEEFLKVVAKTGVEHKELKLGFHYPRAISMIINEAYFALGENLASPESIDLAMKNGVNYPLGPIEWGKKIGLKYIADLLGEYYEVTEDPRYRISKELKLMEKYV